MKIIFWFSKSKQVSENMINETGRQTKANTEMTPIDNVAQLFMYWGRHFFFPVWILLCFFSCPMVLPVYGKSWDCYGFFPNWIHAKYHRGTLLKLHSMGIVDICMVYNVSPWFCSSKLWMNLVSVGSQQSVEKASLPVLTFEWFSEWIL